MLRERFSDALDIQRPQEPLPHLRSPARRLLPDRRRHGAVLAREHLCTADLGPAAGRPRPRRRQGGLGLPRRSSRLGDVPTHRYLGPQERRRLVKRIVPVVYRPSWADRGPHVASPYWSHLDEALDFFMEEPEAGSYRPSNWIVAASYQRHCLAMGWEVQP